MSTTLADLQRFGIPGATTFTEHPDGLVSIVVTTPLATAEVFLHGAHVTRFQPQGQTEVLFMSGSSHLKPGKPIRGGVPLIFPWFGGRAGDPSAPAHGFARTTCWNLVSIADDSQGNVTIILELRDSDATRAVWPHAFVLQHEIRIGTELEMTLRLQNLSDGPLTFEEALHTYLTVGDVRKAQVHGLAGVEYVDKVAGGQRVVQDAGPIEIVAETDRVYLSTQSTCVVMDPVLGRDLTVAKSGSDTTVVWNPWIAKATAMADFGDNEWPGMICVETANAGENAVTLAAGGVHEMKAIVSSRQN